MRCQRAVALFCAGWFATGCANGVVQPMTSANNLQRVRQVANAARDSDQPVSQPRQVKSRPASTKAVAARPAAKVAPASATAAIKRETPVQRAVPPARDVDDAREFSASISRTVEDDTVEESPDVLPMDAEEASPLALAIGDQSRAWADEEDANTTTLAEYGDTVPEDRDSYEERINLTVGESPVDADEAEEFTDAKPDEMPLESASLSEDDASSYTAEQVVSPDALPSEAFRQGVDDADLARASRRIDQVPLTIRPTRGVLPSETPGEQQLANAVAIPVSDTGRHTDSIVGWTPWDFCFRPLYFEDIALERYGYSIGILQPAFSGARFFLTVPALPYKMTVRPPRSCLCSNGFSRPGDCPLPGYTDHYVSLDASLVEAAVILGIIFILP